MDTLNILLEITIYSSIIFMATMLLKSCLKNKMSPLLHYAVWLVFLLRLMIPVTIASPIHLFVMPAGTQSEASVQAEPQSSEFSAAGAYTTEANTVYSQPVSQEVNQTPSKAQPNITAADSKQASLSLPQVIIIIWLTAAGAGILYLATAYTALRRGLRKSSGEPSQRLKALFEEVKADMGVKANVKLVCRYGYGTPSLMFPRTIIMPADALLAMDDEQLVFALRHELTHYRRKDHVMSILLSLLGAVYWFNPFVWMAFYRIRADMETACDSAVAGRLSEAARIRYALLIVSLFARPMRRQPVLGMARADVKKAAQRRVKGIFMNGKSGRSAKLVSALLIVSLLLTCFTTACRPTPESPVVVNKNDGKFEQKLQGPPQPPESYKASKHWSETVKKNNLSIVIDTDVFVPDVTEYPVVKLERTVFTQQQVDKVVRYFAGDKQLHLSHVKTKADWEEWIINAKRGELIDGVYVDTQYTLDDIKYLEEKRAAAPEDSPVINTDTTLTYQKDDAGKDITESGKNFLSVAFDNGNGAESVIYLDNFTPGYNSFTRFSYFAGKNPVYVTESAYKDMLDWGGTEAEYNYVGAGALFDNFGKVEVTPEEAAAQAESVISGLGINHLKLVRTEKYVTPDVPEECGYELVYARASGSIPLYWLSGSSSFSEEQPPQYSPPFFEETARIHVSKNGLVSLVWMGCADVAETVNENVELLPFETIQQRLKDQIFYKKSFMQEDMYRNLTVTVTSAELRMGYIGVKGNPDQALMVPVWVFEANTSYYDKASGTQVSQKDNAYMLNAIDGGVIEYPREPREFIEPDV